MNDQVSMKEKKRILRDDEWLRQQERKPTDGSAPAPSTFHARGTADAMQEQGGRFAALGAPQVIGAAAPKYPAAGVSFPEFLNGPETLGYEIDQLEEVAGEPFEVREAQRILDARMRTASGAHDPDAVAAPEVATPSASVERNSSGSPSRPRSFKRRI